MEFHLNLTIRGLCAYVPMAPFVYGERQTLSRMKILVVDARTPKTITERTQQPLEICAHTPELRLPGEIWPLSDHRIEIEGIDHEFPLMVEPSFGRMSQMDHVAPGAGLIKEGYLAPDPPQGIVATLDLTAGSLEALAPRREELIFYRNGEETAYRGHFTSMVHVQMLARNEVILRAVPVRGGQPFEQRLRPRETDDAVEVVLVNSCSTLSHPEDRGQDSDFAVFYELSSYGEDLLIPRPAPQPDPGRGGVQGEASANPACIDTGFRGPGG